MSHSRVHKAKLSGKVRGVLRSLPRRSNVWLVYPWLVALAVFLMFRWFAVISCTPDPAGLWLVRLIPLWVFLLVFVSARSNGRSSLLWVFRSAVRTSAVFLCVVVSWIAVFPDYPSFGVHEALAISAWLIAIFLAIAIEVAFSDMRSHVAWRLIVGAGVPAIAFAVGVGSVTFRGNRDALPLNARRSWTEICDPIGGELHQSLIVDMERKDFAGYVSNIGLAEMQPGRWSYVKDNCTMNAIYADDRGELNVDCNEP